MSKVPVDPAVSSWYLRKRPAERRFVEDQRLGRTLERVLEERPQVIDADIFLFDELFRRVVVARGEDAHHVCVPFDRDAAT